MIHENVIHRKSPFPKHRNRAPVAKNALKKALQRMCESLESRQMLSISWIGGTGNWNDSTKWAGGVVPTGSADAVISVAGSVVDVTDGEGCAQLSTSAGTTLSIGASGNLSTSSGTIAGTLTAVAGAMISLGNSTVSGTDTITGATFNNGIDNAGALTLNDCILSSTSTNSGSLTIKGGTSISNSSSLTNAADGTITLSDDTGIGWSGLNGGQGPVIINEGTFDLNGGSGTATLSGGAFDDAGGTVNVMSGTLSIEEGEDTFFTNATLNTAAGTAIAMDPADSGFAFYFAGTNTGSGAGQLLFDSGDFQPGQYQSQATSAVMNFPAGYAQVTGSSFSFNPQDGTVGLITNNGSLDYVGSAAHGIINLINNGTVDVTGSSDLLIADGSNSSSFTNSATGIVDFQSDAGFASLGGNTGPFTNSGLIEKTAGTGDSIIGPGSLGGFGFTNDGGTISVQTGTVSLENGEGNVTYTEGPMIVATGATLDIAIGAANFYGAGTFASTGGGQVNFQSGNWVSQNSTPFQLDFAPGVFTVDGGVFGDATNDVNTGAITFTGGGVIGGLANQGTISVADSSAYTDNLGFNNDAAGVLSFAGNASFADGYHGGINNSGLIIKSGGSGVLDLSNASIGNTGTFEAASGTINLPNGLFGNFNAGIIGTGQTFKVDAGAAITVQGQSGLYTNDGTVILAGAGAAFGALDALTTNNGTLEVLTGATLTTTGALASTGTITTGGDLTVGGNFIESQGSGSADPALAFAVGAVPGTSAPLLTVDGTTTLAGTLSAGYASGFAAQPSGSTYTVANFASAATGSFASTAGISPAFTATVNPTSIILDATGNGGTTGGTSMLAFSVEPANGTTTGVLGQVVVDVDSASGSILSSDNSDVTLALAGGTSGATLGGTATVAAVNGVATFSNLVITTPGVGYTLTATDGAFTAAASTAFSIITPVPPSPLVPSLTNVRLVPAVVAGQKLNANVRVVVTNTGVAFKGVITINIFANVGTTLDGNQVKLTFQTKSVSLKAGKTKAYAFTLKSLPSTLPAGAYHLLAEVVDPTGDASVVASAQTVAVAAPYIQPTVSLGAVSPTSVALKKTGSILVTITNAGNISAKGFEISLGLSSDGVTEIPGIYLATFKSGVTILPKKNKTIKLHFKVTSALAAGSFYPFVSVSLGGEATTQVGTILFTIA